MSTSLLLLELAALISPHRLHVRTPCTPHRCATARAVAVADSLLDIRREAEAIGLAGAELVAAKLGADVMKTKASRGDLLTEVDVAVQEIIEQRVRAKFPDHGFLGEESVAAGPKASADALRAALDASESEYLWIVDPIDGTTNFVQGLPLVGISIGVARRTSAGWELAVGCIVDPFSKLGRPEVFSAVAGGGATADGAPISVGDETLADAVVCTGFGPSEASLRPMVRGISAVGAKARTVRMLGSAAIMLAWVACGRLSAYFEADLNAWDMAAGVLLVREAGGVVTGLDGARWEVATRTLIASNAPAHAELQATLADAKVTGLDDV